MSNSSIKGWMSAILLFVMGVWIYFEPVWPKETALISVFHESIQLVDAPCYSCHVLKDFSSGLSLWRCTLISSSFDCAWIVLNLPSSASLMVKVYLLSCMLHEQPLQFWKMCNNNETVCLLCCLCYVIQYTFTWKCEYLIVHVFHFWRKTCNALVLQSHQWASL